MNNVFTQSDKELAVKYFLGDLTESERNEIEERFFVDEDYSFFLDDTERDLLDDYVRGNLDYSEKEKFKKVYLNSAERREKLVFARSLNEKLSQNNFTENAKVETAERSTWLNFFRLPNLVWASGFAAILLLVGIIGVWISGNKTVENVQANTNVNTEINTVTPTPVINSVSPTPTTNVNSNPANRNSNVNKPAPNVPPKTNIDVDKKPVENKKQSENKPVSPPQPSFATLILLPSTRSGEKPTVTINAADKQVNLKIISDNAQDFSDFKVEIRDSIGNLVTQQNIKNASTKSSKTFAVNLAANKISTGLFEVKLIGTAKDNPAKTLNFYEFNIVKK